MSSDQLTELQELLHSDEPLDPVLVPWLEETEFLGTVLKHPLVFSIPFMSPALANRALRQKQEMLAKYKEEQNWWGCVWVYERPYRLEALMDIADEMTDSQYWEMVGDVWTDSENIWQNYEEWLELLSDERPGREFMMSEEEREALASLPEEIEVYRGCHRELNEGGLSWTTDKERATWFAKRFADHRDGEPLVIVGKVKRENVLAYFTGRSESEIVAFEHAVTIVRYEEV